MDKIIAAVYETMDYGKFKMLQCNRDVTEQRKTKLMESFSIGEVLNPIVVNKHFEIIDGQGRYEAKKELGLPIYYVVDEDAGIDDCRRLNTYNTKWTDVDYAKSYAESGNANYIRLMDVCRQLNMNVSTAVKLSGHAVYTKRDEHRIRRGELIFTEEDKNNLLRLSRKIDDIVDALNIKQRVSLTFKASIKIVVDTYGYEHERFVKNCMLYRSSFVVMSRTEDQLKEFSEIYNYRRKSNDNKLYFEDYMRNKGYNVRNYDESNFNEKAFYHNVSTLSK